MILISFIILFYFIGYLDRFISMYYILYTRGFFNTDEEKEIDVISNLLFVTYLSCSWFFVTLEDED